MRVGRLWIAPAPAPAWSTAGASVGLTIAVVAGAAIAAPDAAPVTGYIGGFGVATLTAGLLSGVVLLVAPGVAFVLAAAGLSAGQAGHLLRADAVLSSVACFLAAELAYRSLARRAPLRVPRRVAWRDAMTVATLLLASAAAGVAVLSLVAGRSFGGTGAVTAGIAATVALLALVGAQARRAAEPPTR
jgi:hypothetical protein